MEIKVLIIDDEEKVRSVLKNLILKFSTGFTIIGEADSVESGIKLIEDLKPDAIFLDIEMQDGDGFLLLESFIENRAFKIIFVSSHTQYSLKALKQQAFDYLIKPVMIDELKETLDRLKLDRDFASRGIVGNLIIKTKTQIDSIPYKDIIYLKGDVNYTYINIYLRQPFHIAKTLREFEEQLCTQGSDFVRIHKTFIVNINFISHIQKGVRLAVVLKTGEKISLSRLKKDELLKLL